MALLAKKKARKHGPTYYPQRTEDIKRNSLISLLRVVSEIMRD